MELTNALLQLPRPKGLPKNIRPPTKLGPTCKRIVQTLVECAERAACPPQTLANIFKVYDEDGSGMIAYDECEAMA